jgi:hypothetical protein
MAKSRHKPKLRQKSENVREEKIETLLNKNGETKKRVCLARMGTVQ